MELFRWCMKTCLMLAVMKLLLVERGLARTDSEHGGSEDTEGDQEGLPAERTARGVSSHADHGHHGPKHAHAHHSERPHRRQHSQHRSDVEAETVSPTPLPLKLPRPHALSRSGDGEPHDLLDCQPQQGDRLLARAVVKAEFHPLGFAEASWFYPQNGRDQRTIHCVRVLDQRHDGYGGYVRVVRGGVGHHYVELSFKSDFSRGFNFVVEVYGK